MHVFPWHFTKTFTLEKHTAYIYNGFLYNCFLKLLFNQQKKKKNAKITFNYSTLHFAVVVGKDTRITY